MFSISIVEYLDIFKDTPSSLINILVFVFMYFFGFQASKE